MKDKKIIAKGTKKGTKMGFYPFLTNFPTNAPYLKLIREMPLFKYTKQLGKHWFGFKLLVEISHPELSRDIKFEETRARKSLQTAARK